MKPPRLGLGVLSASAFVVLSSIFAASSAGCGLPLNEKLLGEPNTCTVSDECGPGGSCVERAGTFACESTTVNLGKVLIEVQTNTLSYLFTDQPPLTGAPPESVDLTVPASVSFVGSLRDNDDTGCAAADESIPAKAELRTVLPYATLSTVYVTELQEVDGGYRFAAKVPPGIYDVYVKPDLTKGNCASVVAAPRFFGNVDVRTDTNFTVTYTEDKLTGQANVAPGSTGAPVGWQMELVEPKYGLVVSDTITLGAPENDVIGFSFNYAYTESMVLRLRRPDGKFTIHWLASALGSNDDIRLNLQDLAAAPVNQIANTVYGKSTPLRATVTIQSQHLLGNLGAGASFRVVTESDDKGQINVDLIPGTYQVSLAPIGNEAVSTHIDEWLVSPDAGCCGKTFTLPPQPQIVGRVTRPDGTSFAYAPIVVTPTLKPPSAQEYFDQARATQALLPQQAAITAEGDGSFALSVDQGTLDFAVRPEASSYFPWLVIPSLLVAPAEQTPLVDLGEIPLRAPVPLRGKVASAGKSGLSGARVRFYVPTSTDVEKGTSVVLIGETTTDDQGLFELVVPPELGTRPAE